MSCVATSLTMPTSSVYVQDLLFCRSSARRLPKKKRLGYFWTKTTSAFTAAHLQHLACTYDLINEASAFHDASAPGNVHEKVCVCVCGSGEHRANMRLKVP